MAFNYGPFQIQLEMNPKEHKRKLTELNWNYLYL